MPPDLTVTFYFIISWLRYFRYLEMQYDLFGLSISCKRFNYLGWLILFADISFSQKLLHFTRINNERGEHWNWYVIGWKCQNIPLESFEKIYKKLWLCATSSSVFKSRHHGIVNIWFCSIQFSSRKIWLAFSLAKYKIFMN